MEIHIGPRLMHRHVAQNTMPKMIFTKKMRMIRSGPRLRAAEKGVAVGPVMIT